MRWAINPAISAAFGVRSGSDPLTHHFTRTFKRRFLASSFDLGSGFPPFPDCSNRHGFIESHLDLSRSDRPDALSVVGSSKDSDPTTTTAEFLGRRTTSEVYIGHELST